MRVRERTEELAWANLALESEISERRRAEIQLRETNQRLQKALEELHATQQQVIQQERLRALGKMAGGVAHDFNNALIPILGYAELLIERPELLDDRAGGFEVSQANAHRCQGCDGRGWPAAGVLSTAR